MSRDHSTATVHRYADGTINYAEANQYDLWVRKNSGRIRQRIADIHTNNPSMRRFSMDRVGPLVYAIYEKGYIY